MESRDTFAVEAWLLPHFNEVGVAFRVGCDQERIDNDIFVGELQDAELGVRCILVDCGGGRQDKFGDCTLVIVQPGFTPPADAINDGGDMAETVEKDAEGKADGQGGRACEETCAPKEARDQHGETDDRDGTREEAEDAVAFAEFFFVGHQEFPCERSEPREALLVGGNAFCFVQFDTFWVEGDDVEAPQCSGKLARGMLCKPGGVFVFEVLCCIADSFVCG